MVMIGRVLKETSPFLILVWKRVQVERQRKVVTRVKMVTSPDDFSHRPNVIRSTEECVDSFLVRPWLEIIAEHRIQTILYIVFLSPPVNIHNCSLFCFSRLICVSLPKMVSTCPFPASHRLSSALKSPQL